MSARAKPGCLSRLIAGIVVFVGAVWLLQKVQCDYSPATTQPDDSAAAASQPDAPAADPQIQAERKAFIATLIDQEVLAKVRFHGILADAWVGPRFMALEYDAKSRFANVVYAYLHDSVPPSDRDLVSVQLLDSQTGKRLGIYGRDWAGELKLRME